MLKFGIYLFIFVHMSDGKSPFEKGMGGPKKPIILVGIILALILCCCVSIGSAYAISTIVNNESQKQAGGEKSNSPQEKATVGDTVETSESKLIVNAYETNVEPKSSYYSAEEGNKLIAVDITVTYKGGSDTGSISSYDFTIQDDKAYAYNASWIETKSPTFKSSTLGNGESTRGWLTFEVPKDAQGLTLTFDGFSYLSTEKIIVHLD